MVLIFFLLSELIYTSLNCFYLQKMAMDGGERQQDARSENGAVGVGHG